MRIFVAGAWGAIGRALCPLLVADGHVVTGTTRSPERATALRAVGVTPTIVDVYDGAALAAAVAAARPEVVIHQLTDLPELLTGSATPDTYGRNARVRVEGTRNLVAAALAAGAGRLVAQSICWLYPRGSEPHLESEPLYRPHDGSDTSGVDAVLALERAVTATPGLQGLVLRYGRLYGPHTGVEAPPRSAPVHVEAAARAAQLAVTAGEPGIYNVAEADGYVSIERARRLLGWTPDFRVHSPPQEARR